MKGVKGFQKGNQLGKKFDSETQPESNGRIQGVKNRATIARKWLETETKWLNPLSGAEEKLSLEDQITIARIAAARNNDSEQAYKQLLDSRYGAPKQEIEHSGEVEIGFDMSGLTDEDLKTLLAITQKTKYGKH